MTEQTEKQEFNFNDLMSQINLKDYVGQNQELDEKLFELENKRKEMLRNKLRTKTNNMRNNRMTKDIRQQTQMEQIKKSPVFQNAKSEDEMKKAIDMVASSLSKDPKQKKNIKKQMDSLMSKLKDKDIDDTL